MTKPTTNWAQRTKDTLATTTTTVPAGMQVVGGAGEPIVAFYRFTASKTPNEKSRVISKGDIFEGTYEGKFESKTYPGQYTHKIRTAEGLIGLPGASQLNTRLGGVPNGAKVQVVYNGKNTIQGGKYAGKEAHSFQVASDQVIDGGGEAA